MCGRNVDIWVQDDNLKNVLEPNLFLESRIHRPSVFAQAPSGQREHEHSSGGGGGEACNGYLSSSRLLVRVADMRRTIQRPQDPRRQG